MHMDYGLALNKGEKCNEKLETQYRMAPVLLVFDDYLQYSEQSNVYAYGILMYEVLA